MMPIRAPASRPHTEWLHEQLQDPTFAADYVTAAAEDEPAVYLAALRQVAEAHGMAKVALRLGKLFGNGPELWLNMQSAYDPRRLRHELADVLDEIETVRAA